MYTCRYVVCVMEHLRKSRTVRKLKSLFGYPKRSKRRDGSGAKSRDRTLEAIEGFGHPSLFHATVIIFLEFFSWGLMTSPTITALKTAFPSNTFLKNGIIQGVKGILSFLSAPLLGALSDVWGRKSFLLLSVFFTCLPIPLLLIDARLYFVAIAISGIFAVTFSIVFAYVADCTTENERSYSYGVVSATFAASLVLSPALGTWISEFSGGQKQVIILAVLIIAFNLFFIVYIVPESLPESSRKTTWGSSISWEQADPFAALRKASSDKNLLLLSIMVLLSYLPEAGQYSCFFLYLRQVVGFSLSQVSIFIALLCITSVIAQTLVLSVLMNLFGHRVTIVIGLMLQAIQLFIYGVWSSKWLMWTAGVFASLSSIIYPAISSLVSRNAEPEQQGVVLGILTGMRGLCMGLGPAIFGLLFYLSNVHLDRVEEVSVVGGHIQNTTAPTQPKLLQGLPFLLGVIPVLMAMLVALCIKEKGPLLRRTHSDSSEDNHTLMVSHDASS